MSVLGVSGHRWACLALSAALVGAAGSTAAGASPPVVGATAAVLMDVRTGRVLYARAPDLPWAPASTTKILTALLAMEALPDDALVPVSARAAAERSGSSIGLERGERWKAGDLLHALLMHSANDAAVALAEAVAGSVEQFSLQMNARARALGARRSNFVTPHGRYHPQHYSTAYDLAVMTRAALSVKRFGQIVRAPTWDLTRADRASRTVINTNKLLWRYAGADGVKTGWIAQSGPCLVASATRGGWQLITVVLNAPQMYVDAAALLDYGFSTFAPIVAARRGQVLVEAAVPGGVRPLRAAVPEDVIAVIRRGARISTKIHLRSHAAPVRLGEVVGTAAFISEGVEVARSPLVAAEAVPARSLWNRLLGWLDHLLGGVPTRSREGTQQP